MTFFRTIILTVCFIICSGAYAAGQSSIPTALSELMTAAQMVRTLLAEGRMLEVIDWIVPEKRNQVLAAGRPAFRNPRILGIDLTEDPERVFVRVAVEIAGNPLVSAVRSVARDPWVRVDGHWLYDPASTDGAWFSVPPDESLPDPEEVRKEFAAIFRLINNSIDVGVLSEGERSRLPVAIEYSGEVPISIGTSIPSTFIDFDRVTTRMVSASDTSFDLILNTDGWEGPFRFPIPLSIEYKGVSVESMLTITGDVFAPLTFGLTAAGEPSEGDYRFFLRNNTEQTVKISFVTVDGTLEIVDHSDSIPASGEGFIFLQRKPGVKPNNEVKVFVDPLNSGRQAFSFPFDFSSR
jgi:hypothetical protein